jgi:hypothetical protein
MSTMVWCFAELWPEAATLELEARGATGIIFGTSGYDVERELRAYAGVAGLR